MKIILQRKAEIWIQETYEIDTLDKTTKELIFDYEIDPELVEPILETQYDLGPYEILDENLKVIETGNFLNE